jgi:hypothetical protein
MGSGQFVRCFGLENQLQRTPVTLKRRRAVKRFPGGLPIIFDGVITRFISRNSPLATAQIAARICLRHRRRDHHEIDASHSHSTFPGSAGIPADAWSLDVCHGCRMAIDLDLKCHMCERRVSRRAQPNPTHDAARSSLAPCQLQLRSPQHGERVGVRGAEI